MSAAELHNDSMFLPSTMDWVDGLVASYRATRERMEQMAELFGREDMRGALGFFLDAASKKADRYGLPSVAEIIKLEPGVAALDAHYWGKALHQTDVFEIMPAKRREELGAMIRDHKCPEFTDQTVRDTLGDLLASRWKFFAERVDGIFRSLSSDHVTNQPQGFYKRMILNYVFTDYGTTRYEQAGHISDLRCVIAKLDGLDEPCHGTTDTILKTARENHGEWLLCDGGRIKVKAFLKGTCHLEVHPDICVKLNTVLASLYPSAIPASFRTKPPKPAKDWPLIQRPLLREVLAVLQGASQAFDLVDGRGLSKDRKYMSNTLSIRTSDNKQAVREAEAILEAIGGVKQPGGYFQFDYHPDPVVKGILTSGCIPDKQSHQFYPTPLALAEIAVVLADIRDTDRCLEPSAGTGGLADLMPKDRTTCVEVSKLHAAVLEAKGFHVVLNDFLDTPVHWERRFEKVVMNPPFSEGRWQAHVQAASRLLAPGGRLVAILPSGSRKIVESWEVWWLGPSPSPWRLQWHGPFDNQFPDASVSVVILVATRN